ncbi:MAG: tRNA (adenosine(37)-N6)-threonylcarbamoyltransferase complex ATPase subunit type 1 TsaE [Verrucomicrobiota bacterium]
MATLISHSVEATEALGEQWGRDAMRGWILGLTGDLGSGKTQLVKGLARGLGIRARVHSPTFALLNEYAGGRLPLFHLDLYRLEGPEQVLGAGLDAYLFQSNGVTVIEWVERWITELAAVRVSGETPAHWPKGQLQSAIPPQFRQVWIEGLNETTRRISYEDFGT